MNRERRRKLVFYTETFLYHTENWIHRQLSLLDHFDWRVWARWRANLDHYPVRCILFSEYRESVVARAWLGVLRRLARFSSRRYSLPGYVRSCFKKDFLQNEVDIVWSMFGWNAVQLLELLDDLPSSVRFVFQAGGSDITALRRFPSRYHERLRDVLRRADLVLAGSKFLRQCLIALGSPEPKTRLHYIGVEVPDNEPAETAEGFRVLAVSRLAPVKGVPHTIRAFKLFADRVPEAELVIIGDGEERGRCLALITELGLQGRVRLLGSLPVKDLKRYFSAAHVFVQHNVRAADGSEEALPGSTLEASAHGLPVVGTRSGGVPEAVVDGETGILVEPGDEEGMVRALLALYREPELRKRLGEAGRKYVKAHFDLRCRVRVLEDLFLGLVDSRNSCDRSSH